MQLNGFPVERKKLSDLVPADYNPRRISEKDMKALKKSLKEFGVLEPILINKTTGNIVGGHQRLDALIAIGETETDVIICELSLEKEKAANIALNKISGDWENEKLSNILKELNSNNIDLEIFGFNEEEYNKILSTWFERGENSVNELWQGMPEFNQQDNGSFRDIIVHLKDEQAVIDFEKLVKQKITPKTKYIWFPEVEREVLLDKRY